MVKKGQIANTAALKFAIPALAHRVLRLTIPCSAIVERRKLRGNVGTRFRPTAFLVGLGADVNWQVVNMNVKGPAIRDLVMSASYLWMSRAHAAQQRRRFRALLHCWDMSVAVSAGRIWNAGTIHVLAFVMMGIVGFAP